MTQESIQEDVPTFRAITQRRTDLVQQHASRIASHNAWLASFEAETEELRTQEALLAAGVDLNRLARGRRLIEVEGSIKPIIRECLVNESTVRVSL